MSIVETLTTLAASLEADAQPYDTQLTRNALPSVVTALREAAGEIERLRGHVEAQGRLLAELPPSADQLIHAQMDAAVARTERDTARARVGELEAAHREACPCLHVDPCHERCACRNPVSSSGCHRCCSYGSAEQKRARAERLVRESADAERMRAVYEAAVEWRRCHATRMQQAERRAADPLYVRISDDTQALCDAVDAALAKGATPLRDDCQFCRGAKGNAPGNGNLSRLVNTKV